MTTDRNARRPITRPGQATTPPKPFGQGVDPPPSPLITGAELQARQEAEAIARAEPEAEKSPPKVEIAISAVFDGWPLVISARVPAAKIPKYLASLEKQGYRRPADLAERTPNDEPICPKHRIGMCKHGKNNDTWYSHVVIDPQTNKEAWCKGRPGGDSLGWDL